MATESVKVGRQMAHLLRLSRYMLGALASHFLAPERQSEGPPASTLLCVATSTRETTKGPKTQPKPKKT